MAGPQFVYVMKGLSKTYPGGKQVLKDIWLSFYPGAKIGIVGVNGAGKSTLMRIMAGLDKEFTGEAWAARRRHASAICRRNRSSIPTKDVRGNVMDGVAAEEGAARPLQRNRRQLFRRNRRRNGQAAGQDRGAGPVGSRFARSIRRWTRCAAQMATPM